MPYRRSSQAGGHGESIGEKELMIWILEMVVAADVDHR